MSANVLASFALERNSLYIYCEGVYTHLSHSCTLLIEKQSLPNKIKVCEQ